MLSEIQVNIIKNQAKNFLESKGFIVYDSKVYQHKYDQNVIFVLAWDENDVSKAVDMSGEEIEILDGYIPTKKNFFVFLT
jgi:hypothetical protein